MPNRTINTNYTEEMKLIIVDCLKFIDNNLCEPLDLDSISRHTGYSKYYFARAFKQFIGLSVMEYVKRRKLTFASADLLDEGKIIEVALKYGYDSPGGFTKAFHKEFGFSPSMLRTMKLHLSLLGGDYNMNHLFLDRMDIHLSKETLFAKLLEFVRTNHLGYDIKKLEKAYAFACKAYDGITRYSGDEYVTHPLNVAIILAYLEAPEEVVISGMMCDILTKTNTAASALEKEFPDTVRDLLSRIASFDKDSLSAAEEEDVLMIKLAERLHNMRTVEFLDKNIQKRKAKETIEFFVPFASKLGNVKLTEELNDLALKYA